MTDTIPADSERNQPLGLTLNDGLGAGAVAHCWPWSHVYSPWIDTHNVEKRRTHDNALVSSGVQQQSRCHRCGKLRLRLVMA